jgi:hypothetical protein
METPNRRVLHLHGRDGTRIQADGPALRIDQHQQAPVWMPLDRIAVLVIQGPVEVNSQTIAAVLNAGAAIRLLAADGTALGDLDPHHRDGRDPGDWRPLYERWLIKRNLLETAADIGSRLLKQELGRYLGPGSTLLKALFPSLSDTRTLRQNATRWVHRAIDLIEDAQGSASRSPQYPQPPPTPPAVQPSPAPPAVPPGIPHLQRWRQQQERDDE